MAVPMRDEHREQLSEHEARLVRVEEAVGRLEGEVHDLREEVHDGFGNLRNHVDRRFEQMDAKLDAIAKVVGVEFSEPQDNIKRCPVCEKPFIKGVAGWDGHIGSPDACPTWRPDIQDAAERRRLFEAEHADWLNS